MSDIDMQSEDGRRLALKDAKACLHCYLWKAIDTYYTDGKQIDPVTGKLIYDSREILGHFGDVLAECIASIPDRAHRRQMMTELDRHIRQKVTKYIQEKNHPESRAVKLQ